MGEMAVMSDDFGGGSVMKDCLDGIDSIQQVGLEYEAAQRCLSEAWRRLFSGNRHVVLSRLKEVCRLRSIGKSKAKCTSNPEHIIQNVHGMSVESIAKREYPCSFVHFDIENGNIAIEIEAFFRRETDSKVTVSFPYKTKEYGEYRKGLRDAAALRLRKIRLKDWVEKREREDQERKMLENLKAKYEGL